MFNALLTAHDDPVVQDTLAKPQQTLQQLAILTRTLYESALADKPTDPNVIIPRTARARRLLNHTCKQWNTGITALFTSASLTVTQRIPTTLMHKKKALLALNPKNLKRADFHTTRNIITSINCIHGRIRFLNPALQ